jgi:VWFA-related protein
MRPERDEAAIVSFTGEVTLEHGFTGNLDILRKAIDRVEFVPPSGYIGGGVVVGGTPPISDTNQILAGSTAIWDAVWATSNELMAQSADNTRRTLILLTDGEDTISQVKMHEAIERAQKADALIYAIGIGDSYQGGVDTGSLQKITEQTGGRAYFPRSERELRSAFAQIQRDLREQYLLAYSPTNKARDGSYRRIQIEVIEPELRKQKLKLNYRPGYFAKTTDRDLPVRRRTYP